MVGNGVYDTERGLFHRTGFMGRSGGRDVEQWLCRKMEVILQNRDYITKQGLCRETEFMLRDWGYTTKQSLWGIPGIILYITFHWINAGHNVPSITPNAHFIDDCNELIMTYLERHSNSGSYIGGTQQT